MSAPVSRTEIAGSLENAFSDAPRSPTDLIEFAADHGARTLVLEVLGRLRKPLYRDLRELWGELGDIPVDQ